MDEMSPSNLFSATTPSKMSAEHQLGQMVAKPNDPQAVALNDVHQETVDFTDDGPPSLQWPLTEEYFCLECRPHVFWVNSICIPLPPNPPDLFEALFDCLVEFVAAMVEEDDCFVVLPYHLSNYEDPEDLPPPINDQDSVPDDIDEWLQYFPQAKPHMKGGDLYMLALVGLGKPFPKVMKAPWFHKNMASGNWHYSQKN